MRNYGLPHETPEPRFGDNSVTGPCPLRKRPDHVTLASRIKPKDAASRMTHAEHNLRTSLLVLTLVGGGAWANQAAAQDVTGTQTATPAVTAVEPEQPPPASVEDRVAELEAKLESMKEDSELTKGIVEQLAKIKLSGYIQGRFEWHDDSKDGVDAANKPATTTRFLVRRGRLKATYLGQYAEFMLQIDAASSGVSLKDAEATFIEPWSGWDLRFTVGQFKVPFGYELLQSSGERQMPERARVITTLFPGERDRGFRFQLKHDWLRFYAAVINGNTVNDSLYGGNDSNAMKDFAGRVGVDFDWLVIGLSGYIGEGVGTKLGDLAAMPPTTAVLTKYTKARAGLDVQAYFDVPSVGGLALKGEAIIAKDFDAKAGAATTPFGFWAAAIQSFGTDFNLFIRADYFDPNTDKASDGTFTFGGGAQYFFSPHVKLGAIYEHPISEVAAGASDKKDDILTLQMQAMF